MSCEHYQELVSAALDDELSPEERRTLDMHLRTCADCRQLAEDFRWVRAFALSVEPRSLPQSGRREILRRTVGTTSLWSRLRDRFAGPRHLSRALVWVGSVAVVVVIGHWAMELLRDGENLETVSSRSDRSRQVLRVTISEEDIITTSSSIKVSFTDEDIVKSTTLVLSGDEM